MPSAARWLLFLSLLATSLGGSGCEGETGRHVRVATTTSVQNSGLLDHLLPDFSSRTGIQVRVLAVGTGQALELGRRGDADLVWVHARERELDFVAQGHGTERRDIMWNDFVIVGPAEDPAEIRGLRDAKVALQRIVARAARFVSRGDRSGTHMREQALWEAAGGVPEGKPFYLSAGQGQGQCLVLADEKRAYFLTDRGTLLAFSDRVDLEVLVEGDPSLVNPYGAILVDPTPHPGVRHSEARELLDYLTSLEGQARIASFQVAGQTLFHPAQKSH